MKQNKKILYLITRYSLLIYIILIIGILKISNFSDLVKAPFALPLIFIIPFRTGTTAINCFGNNLFQKISPKGTILRFVISWLFGFGILPLILLTFYWLKINNINAYYFIIWTIIVFGYLFEGDDSYINNLKKYFIRNRKIILFLGFTGIIIAFIINFRSYFPTKLFLLDEQFFLRIGVNLSNNFFNSQIFLMTTRYLPGLSALSALIQSIFQFNVIYSYTYFAPYLLYPIFSISCYALAFYLSKNKFISILTGIMSLLFFVPSTIMSMNNFIPTILVQIIFVPLLYFGYFFSSYLNNDFGDKLIRKRLVMIILAFIPIIVYVYVALAAKYYHAIQISIITEVVCGLLLWLFLNRLLLKYFIILTLIGFSLTFMHYFTGFFAYIFLLFLIFLTLASPKNKKILSLSIIAISAAVLLVFLGDVFSYWNNLSLPYMSGLVNPYLRSEKIQLIDSIYLTTTITILSVALFKGLSCILANKFKNTTSQSLLILLTIIIFLIPIDFSFRILSLTLFPISYLLSDFLINTIRTE